MSGVGEIETATIVAERAGVLAHARVHAGHVRGLLARGRLSAAEATLVTNAVNAFADGVAQGLHVGGDTREVRMAMRPVAKAAAEARADG
jgi:uncharacterized membrane protein